MKAICSAPMSSAASLASARRQSIVVPILALVVASVAVATIALFAVTFSGPPARPAPQPIASIVTLLRGGNAPATMAEWRLNVVTSQEPPRPHRRERRDPVLSRLLAQELGVPEGDAVIYRDPGHDAPPDGISAPFVAGARLNGAWRIAFTPPPSFLSRWHWVTLATMAGLLAGLSALGWLIARAISRPLRELATAASRAHAGAPLAALPSRAPREVAQLGEALSAMHGRLASHAQGRTAMLAAIAHDLGTPLSRLAFWVEQLPDDARARAESDVDEMRAMIAAAIGYARDEMHMRADARVDLGSLLDSLVEDMAVAGVPVTINPGPRAVVRGDPAALRRMFANLIDNAARYGAGGAVDWSVTNDIATIHVDDRGPGIDPAQAEWLFEPFVRGDPSRNRATGGSGLGLAIARSIAQRHGGDATLANRAEGGARATVTLPIDR
jgi:signal transduction histidine kinase